MTSEPVNIPIAETLRNIRLRAGYPTVEALALALEVPTARILTFEAANTPPSEKGDQELVDAYGQMADKETP